MSKQTVSKGLRDAIEAYARLDARQRAIFHRVVVQRTQCEPLYEAAGRAVPSPDPGPAAWVTPLPRPAPEET